MKAIQIMVDETLLGRLDATDEVRTSGRSAVLRQAVREYLERRLRRVVAERYRAAYGNSAGLGAEYAGWEEQGRWPDA